VIKQGFRVSGYSKLQKGFVTNRTVQTHMFFHFKKIPDFGYQHTPSHITSKLRGVTKVEGTIFVEGISHSWKVSPI
jgi:hypothetical protein